MQVYGCLTVTALPTVSALTFLQVIPTKSSFPYRDKGHAKNQFSLEYRWDSIHLPASLVSSPWTYLLDTLLYMHSTGPVIQTWSKRTAGKLLAIISLCLCPQFTSPRGFLTQKPSPRWRTCKINFRRQPPATLVTYTEATEQATSRCVSQDTDSNPLKCSQWELLMYWGKKK